MDMWCPDGIGRDSWDRVEAPSRALSWTLSPQLGEGALAECVLLAGVSGSAPVRIIVVVVVVVVVVAAAAAAAAAVVVPEPL